MFIIINQKVVRLSNVQYYNIEKANRYNEPVNTRKIRAESSRNHNMKSLT